MPFSRKTLTQLIQDVASDIASALPGADALLRFADLTIIGKVLAGFANGHYGYQDYIARNAVPFTSEDEYLEGWAALKKVFRKAATQATGIVILITDCTPGEVIVGEIPITRGDGATYTCTLGGTVDGSGNVSIQASADLAGTDGNVAIGTVMTLGISIAGITGQGTVSAAGNAGVDVETDDELRSRMLQAYQNPPQGGAVADYVEWATDVIGVTRAWCSPNGRGAGTVIVYFMEDDARATYNGFPQGTDGSATAEPRAAAATGDQLVVANYIYPLQPVTALVTIAAPTQNALPFTISGLSALSTDQQNAVIAAMSDAIFRTGTPGGVYIPNALPGFVPGTIDISDIEAAINSIAGTDGFVIESPTVNPTSGPGELPVLGAVTFV